MPGSTKTVTVTVFYSGESHVIQTYPNEYRNLMMLIYDRVFPEEFGECLGMGKCGTCLVEIIESKGILTSYDRNEEVTVSRAGVTGRNVRLSCQILADDRIDGLKVKVLN